MLPPGQLGFLLAWAPTLAAPVLRWTATAPGFTKAARGGTTLRWWLDPPSGLTKQIDGRH
jgi:hypothetical protein